MAIAHIGVAITVVGVTMVSMYEIETNVKLSPGERVDIANYSIEFNGTKNVVGPNYTAIQGQMKVYADGELVTQLLPEQRSYRVQTMGMTEAGIDSNLFRDLYAALGDPVGENAWSIRLYYKPFIIWIWLGGFFMAIGGCFSIAGKRSRSPAPSVVKAKPVALTPQVVIEQ